jgi:hypothetical protein
MLTGSTVGDIELFDHNTRELTAVAGKSGCETLALSLTSLVFLDRLIPEAVHDLKQISKVKKARNIDSKAEVDSFI